MNYEKTSIRSLSVVHVASGDLMAGAEAMLEQLCAEQLRRSNLDPAAALFNDGTLAERLRGRGVPVQVFDESRLSSRAIVKHMRPWLKGRSPNVVHTHGRKENVLGALAMVGRPKCVGVRTVHGQEEHPAGLGQLRRQMEHLVDMLCGRILQDCTVAVAENMAASLPPLLLNAPHRVIFNGVDPNAILASVEVRPEAASASKRRIVYLGRLVPVKRIELIIEAVDMLEQAHPGVFCLEIVGDGPLRAELESFASTVSAEVQFRGFQHAPLNNLSRAAALVLASEHEGLPMAVLEALTLGVPVVAPRTGAIPEIVPPSGGRVLSNVSPASLAEAIGEVALNPDNYLPRLPEFCHAAAMEGAYYALYQDLLQSKVVHADTLVRTERG